MLPRPQRDGPFPGQDREVMEVDASFSGYFGIREQDIVVRSSTRHVRDPPNEPLVSPVDAAMVPCRHLLGEQAQCVTVGDRVRFAHADVRIERIEDKSGVVPVGVPRHALVLGNLDESLSTGRGGAEETLREIVTRGGRSLHRTVGY